MATPAPRDEEIGTLIRKAREAAGLTLTALAEMVSTSPSQISSIELNKQEPNVKTLKKIAEALSLDLRIYFESRHVKKKAPKKA